MKKRLISAIAVVAIVVGGFAAYASALSPKDKFLVIGGPVKLHAHTKLRVPLTCQDDCKISVSDKLILPGMDLASKHPFTGQLAAGNRTYLVLTLNGPATDALKGGVGVSSLKVRADAKSLEDGTVAHALKIFKFKR